MLHGTALTSSLVVLLVLSPSAPAPGRSYPRFSRNDTEFQHLALHPDPSVGTVYVGARDRLFQLDGPAGLRLERQESTGPVSDSKDCLPPVTEQFCPQARSTSNHNKLLLVDAAARQLITCGSVHQGTCQKRSLASIGEVLFSTERPVDTQYVAANDPEVSTVGLVVQLDGGRRTVMYVGRGYTASHPPISTRHLSSEPVFSYEDTAKLAVAGRLSEYDHHFVTAFARRSYVYFLFYRRDIKSVSREYRTYAARVCLEDSSYYSYVEVPLACRSAAHSRSYSLLQAAQVGQGGGRQGEDLLAVFSTHRGSASTSAAAPSALCSFPLDELDRHIDFTRDLCYTQDGRGEGGEEVAYIEYEVKSSCTNLPLNTVRAYPCGSDHTPCPMASRAPLVAEAVFHTPAARLTAVAVSVADGHSIAFLGDSAGTLHKVYLGKDGTVEVYERAVIHPNSPIHSDLLLDPDGSHIYIMSKTALEKRPVAECSDHLDCQSCLSARDPYCGWCVLEGRCGQRWECHRGSRRGQWLWSFNQTQQCLGIQQLSLYNISLGEKTDIAVSVDGLPSLGQGEAYSCFFQDTETPALLTTSGVICSTPDATNLPPIDAGDDFVMVTLSLRFINVTVAETDFTFFNCTLVQELSGRRPCQGCVSSRWGCNWCIHEHVCTHEATCGSGVTIRSRHFIPLAPPLTRLPARTTPRPPFPPTIAPTPSPESTAATTTAQAPPTVTPAHVAVATLTPGTKSTPSLTLGPETATSTVGPFNQTSSGDVMESRRDDVTEFMKDDITESNRDDVTEHRRDDVTEFLKNNVMESSKDDVTEQNENDVMKSTRDYVTEQKGNDVMESTRDDITEHMRDDVTSSSSHRGVPVGESNGLMAGSDVTAAVGATSGTPPAPLALSLDSVGEPLSEEAPPTQRTGEAEVEATRRAVNSPDLTPARAAAVSGSELEAEPQADSDPDPDGLECPCVEEVRGSPLLPVNVERKISLAGRNLNLFQDEDLQYECVLEVEGRSVVVSASVEEDFSQPSVFSVTCEPHRYFYSLPMEEYPATINVRRRNNLFIDSAEDLHVTLFDCSVGRSDCSRCRTAESKYECVWCGGSGSSRCVHRSSCADQVQHSCPAPVIHSLDPVSGPVEGGTVLTISGSNLGQSAEDIEGSVTVAGVRCAVILSRYEVSSRIVCETLGSGGERSGRAAVRVRGEEGVSEQTFSFQDPALSSISPQRGPKAGGSSLTVRGRRLRTGHPGEVAVLIGGVSCRVVSVRDDHIRCVSRESARVGEHNITVRFGGAERHLQGVTYRYTPNPNVTGARPSRSFLKGGRIIRVSGQNLDVVQEPKMRVTLSPPDALPPRRRRRSRGSGRRSGGVPRRWRRIVPEPGCPQGALCQVKQYESRCSINSSSLILCPTPAVGAEAQGARVRVHFLLDSLHFNFSAVAGEAFRYEPDPLLHPLNARHPSTPYHHKPGSIISVEGEFLDLAMHKQEVEARVGDSPCVVKTLTHNHLYCEPPALLPGRKQDGMDSLPEFTVRMGNLNFSLGRVQYDSQAQSTFPLEAQVGVGVGASVVALVVLIIVLVYRRKSKQAMRDYKKVQIQLENLETSVRDRCKKEFTDLMTEMMDMSSDLVGSGIPFLDYRAYAERIFFPGHQESPLRRGLDVPESRRQTVEQGLVQLSNLLNSKLFLIRFIHTLEAQRTFSPRDRAYVASLLTVALHGKLEYFTDILKTLLNDLVEQYVAKNPKLMLRRTESVVEKLLTNWMSICLYTFLRESAGESFYMLFRAIKHQVDKGPVDAVTGKAKYTLNDNRLLREDVEYRTLTLNVAAPTSSAGGVTTAVAASAAAAQTVPAKVLDCDTITQVKEKVLEQTWKGTSFSQRPHIDSLNLEWRAGVAGHLILSDEDLTSVVQGSWKRLNTLQHYKVPDGATVALVPRNNQHLLHDSHDYMPGEKTPMLDDGEEGGVRLWHLVKAGEEAELPKHRKGSVRERGGERAKAIPEIYLTRLLSMKGTLQKFVDDLFTAILSTSRPVPLAVKYFFDLLDEQALQHNIPDPETIHIWKTNSLPLRFWINILKNPQFIFDVQTSDHVDAVLSVIAQTFMDSCTIADHKLGRDSPINKLLYARDIPRYKQMVERYYTDIRQTISASDQEMNSALAELSRNYAPEVNCLVALHELYKYINKYYDQIITALEDDCTAQKMQLGYRLQQIAAAVENKVTDL